MGEREREQGSTLAGQIVRRYERGWAAISKDR